MVARFDLERYVAKFNPKEYGDERAITCPICEKKEKLWVNVKKRIATCYYCEDGYDVVGLVMLLEDCGLKQAATVLIGNARERSTKSLLKGVEGLVERAVEEYEPDDDEVPVMELPRGFVLYERAYPRVPRYFRERGIGRQRAELYRLGWCETGFYANRLIVPIYFRGKLRGFHPRWMKKVPPEGVKKVQYPRGMKSNRMLFNWDVARKKRHLIITEDPFSAMACGLRATAPFGTRISPEQMRLIAGSRAERVTIMWDRDAIAKAHAAAEKLNKEGIHTDVAELEDDRDPDELTAEERRAVLQAVKPSGLAARLRSRLA